MNAKEEEESIFSSKVTNKAQAKREQKAINKAMKKADEAAKPKCPVKVANKRADVLDDSMDAFRTLERGGRTLELKYFHHLNKKTLKWCPRDPLPQRFANNC